MKNSAYPELRVSVRLYIGMIHAIVPNGLRGVVPKLRSASFRTTCSRAWKTVMVMAVCALFSSSAYAVWSQDQLAPPGSSAFLGKIAAVSRIPNSIEVWWIAQDGSVQDAYWYEGGQWNQFTLAPPGSADSFSRIAAVSRIPNSMEIWWIAHDGSVQGAYWYEGGQWQLYQLAPPDSADSAGGITAVSRIPNSMEVWWIGPHGGSVQDAYWYEGGQWNRFELAPSGSASGINSITAVSRIPNSMEVWWIGRDESVQDANWYEGGQWNRFTLAPPLSVAATGGNNLAAVSRIPNSMEVWWIANDGSVQDANWYEGGQWNQFTLAPPGSADYYGVIAAVSRIPNSMEVWWIGPDESVQDANWYEGGQWNQFTLAPPGSAAHVTSKGITESTAGIAAVSRLPSRMEVWWTGANGSVQDDNWYDEPCPYCRASTTKTNRTRDVAVGTVKKSIEDTATQFQGE
jgi:hypothetical protein